MTKSELIKIIHERYPNHAPETITKIVEIIFGDIAKTLIKGNKAEIRRFGSFSIRKRQAKTAKNPKTLENIEIPERSIVYFRMGKELKEMLNSQDNL